jgi:hypothetical protein
MGYKMASLRLSSAVIAAAVLLGSASFAFAQTSTPMPGQTAPKSKVSFSTDTFTAGQPASPDKSQYTGSTTRSVMQWEGAGRWGLKVQLDQSVARETQPKDVEAGAFYKVTPRLRVGGAVGLADKAPPTPRPSTDTTAPRVKLETTLKF